MSQDARVPPLGMFEVGKHKPDCTGRVAFTDQWGWVFAVVNYCDGCAEEEKGEEGSQ